MGDAVESGSLIVRRTGVKIGCNRGIVVAFKIPIDYLMQLQQPAR